MKITWQPEQSYIDQMLKILQSHNRPFYQGAQEKTFAVDLSPEYDVSYGGAYGIIFGHVLEIKYLVLKEDLRKKGYGSKMIQQIEDMARSNQVSKIILNTFSFQAKGFYEKMGFTEVYRIDGYPNQISKHFMEKNLEVKS